MRDEIMYIAVIATADDIKRKLRKTNLIREVLEAYYPKQTVEEIAAILTRGYISKAQKDGTLKKETGEMNQKEKIDFWAFAATTFQKGIKELLVEGVQEKFN